MPITVEVDSEQRLVRASIEGEVTSAEILAAINGSVSHPDFRPGYGILSDHRAVGTPLTTEQVWELRSVLASLSDSLGGARWAVVTTKPASYGMLRMLSVLLEDVPLKLEVFSTLDKARAWLGLDAGPKKG